MCFNEVIIKGGLGNQLFCLLFAYKILLRNKKVHLNLKNYSFPKTQKPKQLLFGSPGAPESPRKPPGSPTAAPVRGPGRNQAVKKNKNWENMKKRSKKEGYKTMLETTGAKF